MHQARKLAQNKVNRAFLPWHDLKNKGIKKQRLQTLGTFEKNLHKVEDAATGHNVCSF